MKDKDYHFLNDYINSNFDLIKKEINRKKERLGK